MPLFGRFFDYSKPGKGVDPDAPKKRPFFLFFELLWRKFSRFLSLNFVYSICMLPLALMVNWLMYAAMYEWVGADAVAEEVAPSLMFSFAISFFNLPAPVWGLLLLASALALGPLTCGITYITRCWTQEKHADLSDLFDHAKRNWKQGLFLGILDIAVYALLMRNLLAVIDYDLVGGFSGTMLSFSRNFSIIGLVVYSFMRLYTYQMAVTFELKITHILKNAWLFSVMGLFRNILATAVFAATFFVFFQLNFLVEVVFYFIFSFSFWAFANNFITFPLIKKLMMPKEEPIEGGEGPEDAPGELPDQVDDRLFKKEE